MLETDQHERRPATFAATVRLPCQRHCFTSAYVFISRRSRPKIDEKNVFYVFLLKFKEHVFLMFF